MERNALRKFKVDVAWALILVFSVSTFLVWIVDREVFQFSIGLSAIESYEPNADFKSELAEEEQNFEKWLESASVKRDPDQYKRAVWNYWPVLAALAVFWIVGSCALIKSSYLRLLGELSDGVSARNKAYVLRDLEILVENSRPVSTTPSENACA